MEINILNSSKDEAEVEIGSLTLAELLRNYLNKDSAVVFAAWKRAHPTEMPVLKVKTKGKTPVKAIKDAVSVVTKDLDKFANDFSKLK
jgi:DNA-directed RNA polymerase subunit L